MNSETSKDIVELLRSTNTHEIAATHYRLLDAAADEIERLRNRIAHLEQALDGLGYLKAINTITVELGPKASGSDDIADALRKVVGR